MERPRIPPDTADHLLRYVQTADADQRQALRFALEWFDAHEYDAAFECLEKAGLSTQDGTVTWS
jgi:hypothetical protein